jgi:transcriptional regulator with XRE-family HTH domain
MSQKRVVDLDALYKLLDTKRRARELSWRALALEVGVSASTLSRMAQGAAPDVEGFARIVGWLDVAADEFISRPARHRQAKPVAEDLTVVVSRHLRASKELSAKNAHALEKIFEAALKQFKDLEGGVPVAHEKMAALVGGMDRAAFEACSRRLERAVRELCQGQPTAAVGAAIHGLVCGNGLLREFLGACEVACLYYAEHLGQPGGGRLLPPWLPGRVPVLR